MAVAHDASSESHTGTTGSVSEASFSWSHNPVGVPKGIGVVSVSQGTADIITAVTYDAVAVPAIPAGTTVDTAGEAATTKLWFLGTGVPTTDPATIVVTRTNNPTVCYAMAFTVTALGDTEIWTAGIVKLEDDGALTEQSVTDDSPGTNSVRYAAGNWGASAVSPAGTNSTAMQSIDFGTRVIQSVFETTAGQGSRLVGFTDAGPEDRGIVHFAVREIPAGGAADDLFPYIGGGYYPGRSY